MVANLIKYLLHVSVFILLLSSNLVKAQDPLKAFPLAEVGNKRFVLHLPKNDNENDLQVELIVGKTVTVDAHNRFSFTGRIEEKNIEGWGYTRYVVDHMDSMINTRIGVNPNEPKVDRFIRLDGTPHLIRYNSKLPVVLYAPKDAEIRYRIWSVLIDTDNIESN